MAALNDTDSRAPAHGAIAGGGLAGRFLDMIGRRHWIAVSVLLLIALAAFLPGFASLQPMDRDEPRFAQATKQMLESGDFIDIRFQDEARHKKPIGIYWLQGAVVATADALGVPQARTTIALYRIPSLVGAVATVLLTYWAGLMLGLARREAFLAGAFMASSILLGVEARFAKTDAVLTACSVAVMGGLAMAFLRPQQRFSLPGAIAFWGTVALAVLVKGPITPMIAGLATIILCVHQRSGRWLLALRPGLGVILVALVVAPWFVAIWVKSGGTFFTEAIGNDMLGKVASGQEKHGAPPGFYLLAFFGTFWPAAVLTAIAVPFVWRHRREPWVVFCLAWILPSWLVFEAVPTKLPHYVLPLYAAIAVLTVRAIFAGAVGPHRPLAKSATVLIPLIPLCVGVGLSAFGLTYDGVLPYAALPGFVLAVAIAVGAWLLFLRGKVIASALISLVAALALSATTFGFAQPLLRSLKLSPRLAEAVAAVDCQRPAVVTAGYREPSLVFLVGTELAMSDGVGAAHFMAGEGCRVALVEARERDAFVAASTALGLSPALVTRVPGFNINGGRRLVVEVYALRRD
ncbi:ArnT family glycosyltransferase [Chelatococcus asaccharovorans]|uniref:ArnT family glycosyltransferase n=1 Tax=Chelatococcus asaccharovorans TaxID=28210 RepID=UPI00224C7A59|nr:glycosyltransferase family 39 protein [Chelatococcus asaccharovorans]CAH1668407.1 4-amino-4-deoxy-L-arabinose transferase-like glycosyltransferase [Chelatococcus asaccharovorans]CAH1680149.1 4-amino-4-deoxy-L-arabinose transferase-like glycosyltransferase [Chelatococcus asaccharovorans]